MRQLVGMADQLDVVAALLEELLGMGGLEIVDADFAARDMGGDRQHRRMRALRVKQTVDKVQVAWAAAAGADREFARQLRLGGGGEGGAFLMAHVNPVDALEASQRIGKAV